MPLAELPALAEEEAAPSNRVLILGAGYAGLRAAQMLGKYADEPGAPEVVLLDRYSYHQIITELPEAASGRKEADRVTMPLEKLLDNSGIRFVQAEVQRIDIKNQLVISTRGSISYGVLIVALGSVTAYYGVPGLAEHALTLKSVEEAEAIEKRVRDVVAQAAQESDAGIRAGLLSVIVGGAGLTGVELAGELAEVLPTLAEQAGLDRTAPRVLLAEAAPVVLPSMPAKVQKEGARILADLGVRLSLGSKVVGADAEGIRLASGDRLVGRTLVWTGGIMAPPILAQSGLPTASNGHVPVDAYLRVADHPEIYVIGDAARILDGIDERPLAPTAQVAVKQAEAAAYNIVASWHGWAQRPYTPSDKGQLVSLGTEKGVASIFNVSLAGRKVLALKALVEEGYRYEVTGRLPLRRS